MSPGGLRTFSLVLLGLTFLAGVVAMISLSTVPMKRCSDWVWKDTVPLGSFLMRTAWFLWADSMSWGTDREPGSDGGATKVDGETSSRRTHLKELLLKRTTTRRIALEISSLKKHLELKQRGKL